MPETYTVTAAKYKGEKPNPHGGVLHKFYVSLLPAPIGSEVVHDVYWQRKSAEMPIGQEVYGHIENGEYGPRFKTDQRPDGNFQRPTNLKPPAANKEDYWDAKDRRIEWAWACNLAAQELAVGAHQSALAHDAVVRRAREIREQAREELDADLGGGDLAIGRGKSPDPTADVSADVLGEDTKAAVAAVMEASPPQKRKLTTLFNEAGIAREAQKAIVLYRCRSEKATKDGASQLITDLLEGATHDQLIAEVHDAARAGDAVAIRARKLIPSATPVDDGSLPELDEPVPADDSVPF